LCIPEETGLRAWVLSAQIVFQLLDLAQLLLAPLLGSVQAFFLLLALVAG
jgi:hypothetical protein